MTEQFAPDPKEPTRCQCVRNHTTFVDGEWPQCDGHGEFNGLCEGCYETHGHMLELKKVSGEQAS